MRILFIGFVVLVLAIQGYSQESEKDLGSWTSFQLNYKPNEKITLKAKPIVRHSSNLRQYVNASIDLMIAYKLNAKWNIQILDRHWFIPDGPDRQFYFFDINHSANLSKGLQLSNTLRYHLALDWNRNDVDFIRFQPVLKYKPNGPFTPFLGYSAFYRLGEQSGLVGARYKLGCGFKISQNESLQFTYWNQDDYNDNFPLANSHILLLNLSISLNRKA